MLRRALLTCGALALAACGTGGSAAEPQSQPTVGNVGALPDYGLADTATNAAPSSSAPSTAGQGDAPSTTNSADGSAEEPTVTTDTERVTGRVGASADGTRLLMIGDSIMAASDVANGGAMCAELVSRGWQVGMDAVEGRQPSTGVEVTRSRVDGDWDAAVVDLGSNYEDDPVAFESYVRQILDALSPMPVLLLTVSEYEERLAEVNFILRDIGRSYDNVRMLEWSERVRFDESLTGDDDLHLTDRGISAYVSMVGIALGDAPDDEPGVCLTLPPSPDSPAAPDAPFGTFDLGGDDGDGDGD